ncbi:MAG: hypothetical protein ACM65M_15415 [Microcoleus sp.]
MKKGVECKIFSAPKIDKDDRAPGLAEDDSPCSHRVQRAIVRVNGAHITPATTATSLA